MNEFSMIRKHIQKEEGLSDEDAARSYSDSILSALLLADPDAYEAWRKAAFKAACAQHAAC